MYLIADILLEERTVHMHHHIFALHIDYWATEQSVIVHLHPIIIAVESIVEVSINAASLDVYPNAVIRRDERAIGRDIIDVYLAIVLGSKEDIESLDKILGIGAPDRSSTCRLERE